MIERFFVGPDALIGPLDGSFRRGDFAAISALRAAAGAAVALRNAPAGAVRAATYFAHGGKVGKTPPGTHPMGYGSASLRLGP